MTKQSEGTKVITVACSLCNGSRWVNTYKPHQSQPDRDICPQCNQFGAMRVVVPDDGKPVFVYPESK